MYVYTYIWNRIIFPSCGNYVKPVAKRISHSSESTSQLDYNTQHKPNREMVKIRKEIHDQLEVKIKLRVVVHPPHTPSMVQPQQHQLESRKNTLANHCLANCYDSKLGKISFSSFFILFFIFLYFLYLSAQKTTHSHW